MGFVLGRSWIIFIFKFQGTCKSRIQNEIPSLDSNAGILIPLTKTCNYGLTCQPLLPFGSCFHISLNNLFKKKKNLESFILPFKYFQTAKFQEKWSQCMNTDTMFHLCPSFGPFPIHPSIFTVLLNFVLIAGLQIT